MRLLRRQARNGTGVLLGTFVLVASAFAHPGSGIVADRHGNVYFVDTGKGVWRVDAQGGLLPHEGPAFHFMTIDANGLFRKTRFPSGPSADIRAVGSDPTLIVSSDYPLTVGRDGALYHPELRPDQRLQVIRMTPSGARSVAATLPASTESGALRWLNGMATGPDGSIYYTEDRAVRRLAQGSITTIAGNVEVSDCNPLPGYGHRLGPALRGLDVASDGTVFVAATACHALLKITPGGDVGVALRTTAPWSPTGVAVADNDIYVLEYLHVQTQDRRDWTPRIEKLSADGRVSIVATVTRR
jgi:hypothetical protein